MPTAALRAFLFAKERRRNLPASPTLTPQPMFPVMSIAFVGTLLTEGSSFYRTLNDRSACAIVTGNAQ